MENTFDDSPKSFSAMSYRLERGVRIRLRAGLLCALLLAGGILIAFLLGPIQLAHLTTALALLMVLGWIIRFYVRTVIAFYCTDTALEVTTVLGRTEMIEWPDVCLFRKKRRYTMLESKEHPAFYFVSVPPEVLGSLASILRETSNARVIGFGGEP